MNTPPTQLHRRPWRRSSRSRHEQGSPGQALIEFAIGLPMMLLIMLGTLDIGQVFLDVVAIRNGCREAASYAARNPEDFPGIEDRLFRHSPVLGDGGTAWSLEYTGDVTDVMSVDGATVILTCSRVFRPITTNFLSSYFGLEPFEISSVATAEVLK